MNYKKIFKTRKMRAKLLHMLRFVPDRPMIRLQYRIKTGRKLDLEHPQRFTEKLQWYKLYYRDPLMKRCVNKFAVRDYVERKGLGDILVPLYGHWSRPEDIDLDALPERFVLKKQHGGGGHDVIICTDKSKLDKEKLAQQLAIRSETVPAGGGGREWAYWEIETGIVAEELLEDDRHPEAGVDDYKFFCYSGRAEYLVVDTDRYIGHKRNFYDRDWQDLHIISDCPPCDREIERPKNFARMLEVAEQLSADFPFVRVDLYNISGRIFFGELTFYPWSGYVQFTPDEADFMLGKDFEIVKWTEDRHEIRERGTEKV
ncbi:MAG: carbonic anhydrase [Oscillospiraceae bacterium]|nr:carbonic anhydrase [Oscillospiraceae bacterium]